MLSSVRTPLSTRLLKGHETNWRLGSSRMTSMVGSPSRTYFAAVAPPHPPPTTTTRRAVFGAKSPFIAVAHPPPSRPTPSPIPDVRRNSRRPGARARQHPLRLVLEIGELEDREAERADDHRERRCPRVLGVAAQERLAERAHEAEPRALEDHPEGGAEEQEDPLRGVAGPRVEERQ